MLTACSLPSHAIATLQRLIFREGRTKGIGRVVRIHYPDGNTASLESEQPFAPTPTAGPVKVSPPSTPADEVEEGVVE